MQTDSNRYRIVFRVHPTKKIRFESRNHYHYVPSTCGGDFFNGHGEDDPFFDLDKQDFFYDPDDDSDDPDEYFDYEEHAFTRTRLLHAYRSDYDFFQRAIRESRIPKGPRALLSMIYSYDLRRANLSIPDLANLLNASKRTINRHLDTLEMFGIHFAYYISPKFTRCISTYLTEENLSAISSVPQFVIHCSLCDSGKPSNNCQLIHPLEKIFHITTGYDFDLSNRRWFEYALSIFEYETVLRIIDMEWNYHFKKFDRFVVWRFEKFVRAAMLRSNVYQIRAGIEA